MPDRNEREVERTAGERLKALLALFVAFVVMAAPMRSSGLLVPDLTRHAPPQAGSAATADRSDAPIAKIEAPERIRAIEKKTSGTGPPLKAASARAFAGDHPLSASARRPLPPASRVQRGILVALPAPTGPPASLA